MLATPFGHPDIAHADVVVPEGPNVLDTFELASDAIYLGERAGTSFQLRRTSFDGKQSQTIDLPFAGTIRGLSTDPRSPGAMFALQGWVKASREIAYDPRPTPRRIPD